jgi:hypothetical protein
MLGVYRRRRVTEIISRVWCTAVHRLLIAGCARCLRTTGSASRGGADGRLYAFRVVRLLGQRMRLGHRRCLAHRAGVHAAPRRLAMEAHLRKLAVRCGAIVRRGDVTSWRQGKVVVTSRSELHASKAIRGGGAHYQDANRLRARAAARLSRSLRSTAGDHEGGRPR